MVVTRGLAWALVVVAVVLVLGALADSVVLVHAAGWAALALGLALALVVMGRALARGPRGGAG